MIFTVDSVIIDTEVCLLHFRKNIFNKYIALMERGLFDGFELFWLKHELTASIRCFLC